MPPREPAAPLRSDALANRDALLRAAAALYGERGLDVPYDEIAREAGVGRATLYRHFPTRDDLLAAILEHIVDELEAAAAELAGEDRFFALFDLALRHQRRHVPLISLLPNRRTLPPQTQALRARVETMFAAPLAEAQAAGVVRDELSPSDIRTLLSMLTAVVRPGTAREEQARAYRLARAALTAT